MCPKPAHDDDEIDTNGMDNDREFEDALLSWRSNSLIPNNSFLVEFWKRHKNWGLEYDPTVTSAEYLSRSRRGHIIFVVIDVFLRLKISLIL